MNDKFYSGKNRVQSEFFNLYPRVVKKKKKHQKKKNLLKDGRISNPNRRMFPNVNCSINSVLVLVGLHLKAGL